MSEISKYIGTPSMGASSMSTPLIIMCLRQIRTSSMLQAAQVRNVL